MNTKFLSENLMVKDDLGDIDEERMVMLKWTLKT
jgi:hypothetical protein